MANKKTNFFRNVVVTNLPALAALILMAIALRITLKFNVVLSFLVLLVVYFFLGVTIELILDKLNARKKQNDLFKKYTAGETSDDAGEEVVSLSLEELLRNTSDDMPAEEIPESTFETEPEDILTELTPSASEEEDALLESLTTGDFDFEEAEAVSDESEAESENESESEDALPEEMPAEELPEELPEEKTEELETPAEPDFLDMTISEFNQTESVASTFEVDDLFIKEEQAIPESDRVDTEVDFDKALIQEALREVNEDAQNMRIQTEAEKKESPAPKSIFENDGFDVGFEPVKRPENQKSILFGSIPDTEDEDFNFVLDEGSIVPAEPPVQKGKVRVDPKKIDELYTITRNRKEGGSIFGRKKKR